MDLLPNSAMDINDYDEESGVDPNAPIYRSSAYLTDLSKGSESGTVNKTGTHSGTTGTGGEDITDSTGQQKSPKPAAISEGFVKERVSKASTHLLTYCYGHFW